jgi:hypothetical protein
MRLFDRLRGFDNDGTEVKKLPIWPVISRFTRVLDGSMSPQSFIDHFELDQQEQEELTAALAGVVGVMQSTIASYETNLNTTTAVATELARARIHAIVWHLFVGVEDGTVDLQEFQTTLNIA